MRCECCLYRNRPPAAEPRIQAAGVRRAASQDSQMDGALTLSADICSGLKIRITDVSRTDPVFSHSEDDLMTVELREAMPDICGCQKVCDGGLYTLK
ncbi:hypothetical protein NDU88_007320 [Pleurodeles waltl]|uniref:Uncharacterized protein n=1 Tax=Pleurodeles waltl TaxID=8319 RepID=A0AAV7MMM0_PLEWA|nr:hypothetical protein NDU88_007320 [Pleurodeles waltl]